MTMIFWQPRPIPLPTVAAAFARSPQDALTPLLPRLLTPHPSWHGVMVTIPPILVLLGQELPWVDGVQYFGIDPLAPTLLVPTAITPSQPLDLIERALQQKYPKIQAPVVLFQDFRLVSLAHARPIHPRTLSELGLPS